MRWKIAETKLNTSLHGMLIEKQGSTLKYTVIEAADGKRIFYPEKNYLYPITQSAIDKNKNLTQNPNY